MVHNKATVACIKTFAMFVVGAKLRNSSSIALELRCHNHGTDSIIMRNKYKRVGLLLLFVYSLQRSIFVICYISYNSNRMIWTLASIAFNQSLYKCKRLNVLAIMTKRVKYNFYFLSKWHNVCSPYSSIKHH